MKKSLKQRSLKINKEIYQNNLSILNFGNASVIDRKAKKLFIKASGTDIKRCKLSNIVEVDMNNFDLKKFEKNKPSVDTEIHIKLYKYLKNINCIIHSHCEYSTIVSQLNIEPECYGTTHADFFKGKIPLSNRIKKVNKSNYEYQVAQSILLRLKKTKINYPGILLRDHGVFAWGKSEKEALDNLIAIEYICRLYIKTKFFLKIPRISKNLASFHYLRKNGKKKYYGQKKP